MNSNTSDPTQSERTRAGLGSTLGERLRLAREARGISLREISEQTRISTRYLEQIEADDYKNLPGGIFNRSFVKAFARHVGVNEDEALALYARTIREKGTEEDVPAISRQSLVYTDGDSGRSPAFNWLLSILLLAGLSLIVLGGLHWYQRRNAPPVAETPQTNGQAAQTPAEQPTPTPPQRLNVQITARGQNVWMRAIKDEGTPAQSREEFTLRNGETRQFAPEQRLVLQYARVNARALEVLINGRAANVPSEFRANPAEMIITPDNYQELLQ